MRKIKTNGLDNIYDVIEFCEANQSFINLPIFALLPNDELIQLSQQFYIEEGNWYLLLDDNKLNILTLDAFLGNINYESSDSCWYDEEEEYENDDRSHLGDCPVIFANVLCGEFETEENEKDMYNIYDVNITEDKIIFYVNR